MESRGIWRGISSVLGHFILASPASEAQLGTPRPPLTSAEASELCRSNRCPGQKPAAASRSRCHARQAPATPGGHRPFPSTTRRRELRAAIKQFACSNFWRGWSITVQGRTSDGDLRDYAVPWGIAFSAVLLVQAFQHASRSRPTASRTSANDAPGAPCAPVCASSSIAVAVEDGACVTVTDLSPPARDRPARSAMGVDEAPRARLSRRGLKWDVT